MSRNRMGVLGLGLGFLLLAQLAHTESLFSKEQNLSFKAEELIYLAQGATAETGKTKKESSRDWGGFGGPFVSYLCIDLDELEPMTKERGMDDDFEDHLVLLGGLGGLIYKDFRFGGFGFGTINQEVDDEVNGEELEAKIGIGGGGLFMEFNHTFSKNFGALLGIMGGAMGISLEAKGSDMGGDEEWSETEPVWFGMPYAGLWIAPLDWFWLQVSAGYLYFDMDSSKYENQDTGMDMMKGDLDPSWQFNLNLLFGYNPNK